ncbi:MAG: cytochrome c [Fimbriimonadaceae bacterium]|nr:cytochrome c [Fimbriimonadaceae bacterium]
MLNRTNTLLLLALLLTLAAQGLLRPRTDRPAPAWPLSNMGRSPAAKSYRANPRLPGGQVLQAPPAGAVPAGQPPLRYGPGPDEAARAGRELQSPYQGSDPAVLAAGEKGYQTFCTPCHGAGGKGDGMVAQRGFPPPPDLAADHARSLPDGQILHLITHGQKNMPGHGRQIPVEQRWWIVAYVRQLQAAAAPAASTDAAAPATTPAAGSTR